MIFKNLNLNDKLVDIEVRNGYIHKIGEKLDGEEYIDCHNLLVLPPFNDPHVHVDSTFSVGEPTFNKSGSLFEGIEIWRERKKLLDESDFIKRSDKLFKRYVANGVQNIRAHIDVTNGDVEIIKWTLRQKQKWSNKINIQIAAFPQDGVLSTKNGKKNLKKAIEYGADVLGGIPHYELSTKLGNESIEYILDLALKHDLLVDMHCDEIDDGNSKFLEHLSAETWLRGMQGRVTASHTTAFAHYNNAYVRKLWRSLQKSKIHFVANPLVNVHLGGRFDEKNPGRGITRVKEMLSNKINVAYGHDDIQDPWYSLGDANMLQVLFMGIHLNHLTGIDEIKKSFDLITTNSAKLLGLKEFEIQVGNSANFIVLEAKTKYDAIRLISNVKYNIKNGKIINIQNKF